MKYLKHLKYISTRVFIFGLAVLILLSAFTILQGIQTLSGEVLLWPFMIMVILCVLFILSAGVFIVRPYLQSERVVKRFLDGYYMTDEADINQVVLTPMSQLEMQRLDQILHSSQLMDISKRQAQYLALQNQINPHFLYNTLESIRSEALIAGLDSVADMTEALASFFRYTISNMENMVTLEEELDNINTYFLIQKYRFEERIGLTIEYDEEEHDLLNHCLLPKLTLQPVVENSIIHGIERKMGFSTVRIVLRCTEKRLIIQVSDDGIGMQPEALDDLNRKLNQSLFESLHNKKKKGGIALVNVNNRIHLIFGEEYGITVYSTPGVGTDVMIELPLVTSRRELKKVDFDKV